MPESTASQKRRPVNLTIRQDLLDEAKSLKLNASRAAEAGLREAIKLERERQWRAENGQAINAHNMRVEESGTLLTPSWLKN